MFLIELHKLWLAVLWVFCCHTDSSLKLCRPITVVRSKPWVRNVTLVSFSQVPPNTVLTIDLARWFKILVNYLQSHHLPLAKCFSVNKPITFWVEVFVNGEFVVGPLVTRIP